MTARWISFQKEKQWYVLCLVCTVDNELLDPFTVVEVATVFVLHRFLHHLLCDGTPGADAGTHHDQIITLPISLQQTEDRKRIDRCNMYYC